MPEFTILVRAEIASKCFLAEVLYWRAFGRVPREFSDHNGLWRDSTETLDGPEAPIPDGEELSDDECRYAGIPSDPRMQALLTERPSLSVEHYEKMIGIIQTFDPPDPEALRKQREDLIEAKKYHTEVEAWTQILDEYLDQFKAEICLDLRRGRLAAFGRNLPDPSLDISFEQLDGNGVWFDTLKIEDIPEIAWLTSDVNWLDSSIFGKSSSYIWIHVNVQQMLNRYPPNSLLKPEQVFPIGASVAVSGLSTARPASGTNRGRPPLPWDDFHVEVARLYATGRMPEKKEAAIALFQDWFGQNAGKTASRSAIGAKLKPYFDRIGRKY